MFCSRLLSQPAGAAVLAVLSLLIPTAATAQVPQDTAPLEVARIFAARYPETPGISYIPALAWSGALRLAARTGEERWREKAVAEMRPWLGGDEPSVPDPPRLTSLAGHVAFSDLAAASGDPAATAMAREAARLMLPTGNEEVVGFATGWTDDMYMAASLLSHEAARAPDVRYAETVGTLLVTYAEELQREDGLFEHAGTGPYAWGRGNGFAALGLAEALTHLPADWPDRERVVEIHRRQMRALLTYQTDDGSWRQVVDEPSSYRELTVTALTVSALARGVRLGWLDQDEFGTAIERGWSAVLARIGPDGTVRDVCASTPAGTTLEFYLERPVVDGVDDRAGAIVLLAALEMEELRRSR